MAIDFNDAKRYIDLSKHFEVQKAYMDFEDVAFSDTDQIVKKVDELMETGKLMVTEENAEILRELLIHQIGSAIAMVGIEEVNGDYCAGVMEAYANILGVRYIMKSSAEEVKD